MSEVSISRDISNPGGSESSTLLDDKVAETDMRLHKCWDSKRKIQVDILACLFGISAWLAVNALFTQLPILVERAPEGWNLPSYLSLLTQAANIGPVLYSISQKYFPRLVKDSKLIYFILLLCLVSLILVALYYDHIWIISGNPHSGVLFILYFCFALVGCTSSVLFIPFMNNYPEVYLISYMVGEGLSGFLPSFIALIQGVGRTHCVNSTTASGEFISIPQSLPPRFSSELFFFLIFTLMAVSTISFFLLNNLPTCKEQKVRKPISKRSSVTTPTVDMYTEPAEYAPTSSTPTHLTPGIRNSLLLLITIISLFANGALPSLQSYSCLPYGNLAYHLAVNLGHIANPAACFLAYFVPHTETNWIFSLTSLSGIVVTYVISTAALSPSPPLQDSTWGAIIVVLSWCTISGLISYVKMSIATIFRREGGRGLYFYGCMTQFGATIGSGVMFYLINYRNIFNKYEPCR